MRTKDLMQRIADSAYTLLARFTDWGLWALAAKQPPTRGFPVAIGDPAPSASIMVSRLEAGLDFLDCEYPRGLSVLVGISAACLFNGYQDTSAFFSNNRGPWFSRANSLAPLMLHRFAWLAL